MKQGWLADGGATISGCRWRAFGQPENGRAQRLGWRRLSWQLFRLRCMALFFHVLPFKVLAQIKRLGFVYPCKNVIPHHRRAKQADRIKKHAVIVFVEPQQDKAVNRRKAQAGKQAGPAKIINQDGNSKKAAKRLNLRIIVSILSLLVCQRQPETHGARQACLPFQAAYPPHPSEHHPAAQKQPETPFRAAKPVYPFSGCLWRKIRQPA